MLIELASTLVLNTIPRLRSVRRKAQMLIELASTLVWNTIPRLRSVRQKAQMLIENYQEYNYIRVIL